MGNGRRAGSFHRSRPGPRRQPDLDPRAQRTPDRAQRAAVQLDGVARDNQPVTAARLPGARANVEKRAHQACPAIEHADRYLAATHAPRDGHGATSVLHGICNQIVERLRESHWIPVNARHTGAPIERDLPRSQGQRHVPSIHDPSRDVLEVDQLRCGADRAGGTPRATSRSLATESARSYPWSSASTRDRSDVPEGRSSRDSAAPIAVSAPRSSWSKGDGTQAADQAAAPEDLHRGGTCRGS